MKDMLKEIAHDKEVPALIASVPASPEQRRTAVGVIIFLSVVFALVTPFARIQTAPVVAFIPVVQSIICFADLITAVFLFAQYLIQPQRAILALASGYIFSGVFAFLQTLDFPGAYSATGLLSNGLSGAAWLFSFWHILFPLAVIAYVLLKDANESASRLVTLQPGRVIAVTIACVLAVTAGLTWLVTAEYLPRLFVNTTLMTPFLQNLAGVMWVLNAAALVLLFVRRRSILDVWLIVTVFVSLPDMSLTFFYDVVRYSIGWYTARSYALIASCTVLSVLLVETTMLYTRLASAIILQRREGANRLMSVDAATAAIAHEIKQPLAAISSFGSAALTWLKRTPPAIERVDTCVTHMMGASKRANEIVESVRGLFKTTAQQMTPIEINRLVQQVLRMVENDLYAQEISVSTEFEEDLPQIMGDRTLLQQVILNLVKNAIEAMAAGPTTIKALRLVTTQDANSVVSLSVQDSGPGITAENVTRIFDPFFTTKSSGMGLGLSICRRIIDDHGGDLRLIKTGSNGCTFKITLPSVATSDSGDFSRAIASTGSGIERVGHTDTSPALANK
ncbi:MAG: MASE4 domain-containing protein [Xanthobacteraceae bacterium]